jgi:hypothetical protein
MTKTFWRAKGRNRLCFSSLCSVSLIWAALPAAQAEQVNLIEQTGYVSLGTFLNNSEMKIRVDAEGDQGSVVDWNRTFGDKDVNRFRLDGVWRINPRHHVRMMYTDYSRDNSQTIDQDIEWQGDTIPASATARSHLGFTIIEAAYEYGFMHSDTLELVGSAGLHYTQLEASLKATVDLGGGGGTAELGGPASVNAPLPVVGGRALWRMGGNFYLDAQAQYFALSFDGFDGSISSYRAAAIWQPSRYVGIGAGFDTFNINVDLDKNNLTGKMDWTYSGPQVFFNVSF